ncbi:MAG: (deoxy)nucleoside triphosphate pyrophosphohydrolase [Candidatus Coproplasma sp.]
MDGKELVKPTLEVVAALIWQGDRFLICRRPENKARALLWEFVGGKVESGETKEQALIRECREELDITVQPDGVFCSLTHEYEDIKIRLTLFNCTIVGGQPTLLEHSDMRWITVGEIPLYDFCPADKEILALLENK